MMTSADMLAAIQGFMQMFVRMQTLNTAPGHYGVKLNTVIKKVTSAPVYLTHTEQHTTARTATHLFWRSFKERGLFVFKPVVIFGFETWLNRLIFLHKDVRSIITLSEKNTQIIAFAGFGWSIHCDDANCNDMIYCNYMILRKSE